MTSNSNQIINEIKNVLTTEYGELIQSIVLFGSRAKGNATQDSDYDLLVILNRDIDWKFEKQLSKTFYRIELEKDIFTDPHYISVNQLSNSIVGKDPLFTNAIKYGIYAQ